MTELTQNLAELLQWLRENRPDMPLLTVQMDDGSVVIYDVKTGEPL